MTKFKEQLQSEKFERIVNEIKKIDQKHGYLLEKLHREYLKTYRKESRWLALLPPKANKTEALKRQAFAHMLADFLCILIDIKNTEL
jgi:pyruvate-formate lyase-activating enzyme